MLKEVPSSKVKGNNAWFQKSTCENRMMVDCRVRFCERFELNVTFLDPI